MDKKLYKLMDWAAIEGIVYADDPHADEILGCHENKGNQSLVQCFFPKASKITLCYKDGKNTKTVAMQLADEEGFFAALVPGKIGKDYSYKVTYENDKNEYEFLDPYAFKAPESEEVIKKFLAGSLYNAQDYFGAHKTVVDGTSGILFRVYAPMADCVSLIGDFDRYDSRSLPMIKNDETGVFSLFIPTLKEKEKAEYMYEIRTSKGKVVRKLDPYAATHVRKDGLHESALLKNVKKYAPVKTVEAEPFLLYTFDSVSEIPDDYEQKAKDIKELGFTHVSVGNLLSERMSHDVHVAKTFFDNPASTKVKKFIDALHKVGLKVIGVLALSCFDLDSESLTAFDGSCIYEHLDERQGKHYKYLAGLFNYDRGEVKSFLLSAALRYVNCFELDGIRLADTSFMLYLDYAKDAGMWIPNIYGGNENLSAIAFIKELNRMLKKEYPGLLLMTDEFSGWQNMTKSQDDDGFGFDLKWNHAYTSELYKYLSLNPINRSAHHHELTMSYLYQQIEKFVLAITQDALTKCSTGEDQLFNSEYADTNKLIYAYTMFHPGKKAFKNSFVSALDSNFVKATNSMYLECAALNQLDSQPEGFEWINEISANECVLTYTRKSVNPEETLLVVVNMAGCDWENYKIGVPMDGKYKPVYVSENAKFGGLVNMKQTLVKCKKDECDMRDYSIRIKIPALSVSVYSFVPYTPEELEAIRAKEEEKRLKEEEARKKKELLKKKKDKIKKTMKEKLAREIAKAEEEIYRS